MNTLIIEDDRGMANAISATVEPFSDNLWIAETLKEGMAILRSGRVDLLLLDLMLPDSNEVQTLQNIRAIKAIDKKLAVLVITGVSHVEREEAESFGADGFIHKRSRVWQEIIPEALRAIHNTGRPDYEVFVKLLTRMSNK